MSDVIKLGMRNTREQNKKCLERATWENPEVKRLRENAQRFLKTDIRDPKAFPVHEMDFDWSKVRRKLMERASSFQEADSASTFVQVLRAGIQTLVNTMYMSVESTYEDWVQVVNSTKFEELYAPLHGIAFPREVGPQEVYPEVGAAGLDLKLRNRKFGTLYPIELELLKFDQTGQFQQQAALIGEYLKLVQEVYVYGKLASPSGGCSYSNLTVPVSETKPSTEATYPWVGAPGLQGGGITKLTAAALSQSTIQAADIQLMNQLNLLGLKMSARGTRILVGPANKFTLGVLLNSSFFPTAQTTGTGTINSINPIQGLYNMTVSRFMFNNSGTANANSTAWYMIDDTKPWFVLQMAEAAVVEQEAVNAGQSFDRDIVRFKGRTMFNADFIDPRFAIQGNDGSV